MIYLDNAATTMQKPPEVVEAVTRALTSMGNAGRGAHEASLDAGRAIFSARKKLTAFFHGTNPGQLIFTANSTESLNIAIKGILNPGDHVITTQLEHNSVLRPLYEMEEKGTELTVVESDRMGNIRIEDIKKSIRENTRAIVCTHASNLTGNLIDIRAVGRIAKEHGLLFVVDASQTAGIFPIDVEENHIDILCFTGHKAMLGPQGTGGMYVKEGVKVRPLLSGGSGVHSYSRRHPVQMPEALEAGTLNAHGIAGLAAAVDYINRTGMDKIREKEQSLMQYFYERVREIPGITVYGDYSGAQRCPVTAINIRDYDSAQVSDVLFAEYGIATRPGAHCAPLMHQALGTVEQGIVRFSFSHYNTIEEIDEVLEAIKALADET